MSSDGAAAKLWRVQLVEHAGRMCASTRTIGPRAAKQRWHAKSVSGFRNSALRVAARKSPAARLGRAGLVAGGHQHRRKPKRKPCRVWVGYGLGSQPSHPNPGRK
jgi:hypothetical protein